MCCQDPPGAASASRMTWSRPLAAQVAAGGEPSLAATDHHHVRVLRHGAVVTAPAANFLRQASAT